jgi:hypothetical protein
MSFSQIPKQHSINEGDNIIAIIPAPLNGKPFRINFVNRGREYWYNENASMKISGSPMLFEWKCPFGIHGEPELIDGVWFWLRTHLKQ